jgi:hypothetical protein
MANHRIPQTAVIAALGILYGTLLADCWEASA